jgi:hypothetical protein
MLKIAIMPLGKTMYIYGGGWNEKDNGAGRECMSYGLSPKWVAFANTRESDYDFRAYDYKKDSSVRHLGLDCSGYVGWVLYNSLKTGEGYVFKSVEVVKRLTSMGIGEYVAREAVVKRRAGDIMSSACDCCKHVYICVGECDDGSLVLLHSSPHGVRLSGTCTVDGNEKSEAVVVAEKYMKRYYPRWYARYPYISVPETYLTHYEQLSNTFFTDKEGFREMKPDEILKVAFKLDRTNLQ